MAPCLPRVAVINSGVEPRLIWPVSSWPVTLLNLVTSCGYAVLVTQLKPAQRGFFTPKQTTEIGADGRVNGLPPTAPSARATMWRVGGVPVQICPVPNTEWLKGTLELASTATLMLADKTSWFGVFTQASDHGALQARS
jgi:alkyl hydroperoxide reductase subunit AhpF